MTSTLGEVLGQLRELVRTLDQAAGVALGASEQARQAYAGYREAGTGSQHVAVRRAETDARTAAEKAAKIARLLAESGNAFSDYINAISPGMIPSRTAAFNAMPSGERIAVEAQEAPSRFNKFMTEMGQDADDKYEAVTTVVARVGSGLVGGARKWRPDGGDGMATNTKPSDPPMQSSYGTAIGDAAASFLFTAIAVAVVRRRIKNIVARRRERNSDLDHEK